MLGNFLRNQLEKRGWVHRSRLQEMARRNYGFPAAGVGRLLEDWTTTNVSMDAILRRDLPKLRARSRNLALKDPYFHKYLSLLKTNIVGANGVTLKNKAQDPPRLISGRIVVNLDKLANRLIEDAWFEWGKMENCTLSKDRTWADVQTQIIETEGTDGEILIRKVFGAAAKNRFNFALQLYEGDFLDVEKNDVLQNGNTIRMGVEKNPAGERVAYWVFKSNPSDTYYPVSVDRRYERIPANEFLHPFLGRRVGQTRGYPLAAASMLRMQMLDGYDEGELIACRAGANKHGYFKRTGNVSYQGEQRGDFRLMDSEPGTWEELPMGLEPVAIDWNHPAGNYDPFVKACLRGIAAGLLVSYPTLANDYASVNFSSGRMAQMEEREVWKTLQRWFSDHVCTPIFSSWLETSLLAGAIPPLPLSKFDKFNQPNWHGRTWSWVDPVKEVTAKIMEINGGLTSLTRSLAEQSIDRDELLDEIADDKEALKSRGIELTEIYPPPPPEPTMAAAGD